MAIRRTLAAAVVAITTSASVSTASADVTILSGGALEAGLRPVVARFEQQQQRQPGGIRVTLRFATAPEIRQRLLAGEAVDLVIAPPAVLDAVAGTRSWAAASRRTDVGSVAIGVVVRDGRRLPDLANVAALTGSLRAADQLVYNRASTGQEIEAAFAQTGLDREFAAKTTRYPDGASVMRHVLAADGEAIGFGAVTEILPFRAQGLRFVGLLPDGWQKRTRYAAVATTDDAVVAAVLQALTATDAAPLWAEAGVESAR